MFIADHHWFQRRSILLIMEGVMIFTSFLLNELAGRSLNPSLFVKNEFWIQQIFGATLIFQLSIYYHGLYEDEAIPFQKSSVVRIFQALGLGFLLVLIFMGLSPAFRMEPEPFLIHLSVLPFFLLLWRFTYSRLHQKVFGKRALIIGTSGLAKSVGTELVRRPELGYQVVGFIDQDPSNIGKRVVNPGVIGSYENLEEVISKHAVQQVIVAMDDRRGQLPLSRLIPSKLNGVRINDIVGFYEGLTGKIIVDQLKPSGVIFGRGFQPTRLTLGIKRWMDLVLATAGLTVSGPLFLVIALLIKLTSPGPVFYQQNRVGKGGELFTVFKFRSMRSDAEQGTGAVWAQEDDPRVTPFGRVLRKFRLDELPQMINVLRGEMSFVGPRPERPEFVQNLRKKIAYYDLRLSVKPGITGWAQVRFNYGGTFDGALEKLQFDLYYIKNVSLLLDFVILVDTVNVVLFGKGAR